MKKVKQVAPHLYVISRKDALEWALSMMTPPEDKQSETDSEPRHPWRPNRDRGL